MTLAQVQPLNTPTPSELTKAHNFLYEADLLVTDVKSLFRNSGDFVIAAGSMTFRVASLMRFEPLNG